ELVAERLARTRRHHRERMLTGDYAIDDLLLHAAEGMEAEDGLENRMGIAGHSPPLPAWTEPVEPAANALCRKAVGRLASHHAAPLRDQPSCAPRQRQCGPRRGI